MATVRILQQHQTRMDYQLGTVSTCRLVLAFVSISLVIATCGSDIEVRSSDGNSVNYTELSAAVASLQSGDTLHIRSGRYNIIPGYTPGAHDETQAPLQIRNLSDVAIVGEGLSTTIFGAGPGDFLFIRDSTNIRIENIRFEGDRPEVSDIAAGAPHLQLFSMILLSGTNSRIRIHDCEFLNFGNHAVSHLHGDKISSLVSIENCHFANGGDAAIGPDDDGDKDGASVSGIGSHWTIANNDVVGCVRGFEIENGGDSIVRNIHIRDNRLLNTSDIGIMLFSSNSRADAFVDIAITGNQLYNETPLGTGLLIGGGTRIRIVGNNVHNTEKYGICVSGIFAPISNVIIEGNVVTDAGWRGIQVSSFGTNRVDSVLIRGNSITRSAHAGILVNGNNITLAFNHCSNNARRETNAGIQPLIPRAVSLSATAAGIPLPPPVRNLES